MAQQKKGNAKTTTERDNLDELPQEITESYGTGVIDQRGLSQDDITTLQDSSSEYSATSSQIGGEDGDPAAEQESATGEQSVGGTAPTPDMDMVDELGAAAGIEMADGAILHTTNMLERRDESRWELEPSSAEDYQERSDL
ncbi:hypothetical protein Osc7112_2407 [Oscillatoria nigro-viridis PCC 7112]|uniref:Uncharacterized protein n=1 Tax=Phormidium nigroviride PCC 7112 TaxID=179408 RepID=K9VH42_9CYAN|nr:DUF6335 family protein [Oscillatoria nigro-viridis]AFZ06849.1 hypothetical protein Osc7112_2407 [Oscillatoria nigro-viridis PCC 7112]